MFSRDDAPPAAASALLAVAITADRTPSCSSLWSTGVFDYKAGSRCRRAHHQPRACDRHSNMDTLLKVGRFCFAISIAFFGLQYLLYGRLVGGLPPVPPWTPGGRGLAYLIGVALIATGLSIATLWHARLSATSLGVLFLLCVVFLLALRTAE